VPGVSRIAILANLTNPGKALELKALSDQAQTLGVTLQSVEVPSPTTLDAAFSANGRTHPEALITLADAVTLSQRQRIVEFAATHRVPGIYQVREFTDAGGLFGFSRLSFISPKAFLQPSESCSLCSFMQGPNFPSPGFMPGQRG
jgi:putative ABC transport system substrate-binding protein